MDSLSGKSRSGADSRSARDSTTLPTVDPFGAHDDDPPNAPGALAPARHPTETILDVPAKLVVPRPTSPPSGGRHADPNATEQSWPDTPSPCYGLRRNSREIVDAQRPRRRAISRTPTPCA